MIARSSDNTEATSDARLVELVVHNDDRGNFARTWCVNSFLEQGIDFRPVQGNTSFTGTVQGMHFQRAPKADAKAGSLHGRRIRARSVWRLSL